jgi:hypothetical protein
MIHRQHILQKFSISTRSFLAALLTSLSLLQVSCGSNTFSDFEEKDPAEDAAVALEQGNPTRAVNILTKALEDDSENQTLLSLLGMAYAQRAGVDPLTFVERMGSDSSSNSGNGVTALFGVMPEATSERIADVDLAISTLYRIPTADLKAWDKLKLAMFQTAAMTLRAKALDSNGDGALAPEEVLELSTDNAVAIVNQLAQASGLLSSDLGIGGTSNAGSRVSAIQEAIADQPGSTDEERLRNYLANRG